nr:site-specific DNA-methyltransferase [Pseudoclavibacter helvolus]
MKSFADSSVDAIVTDPPYELGFMGKGWDSSGIAYSVELWSEALRVLKPGGHLLAFGGSRTFHRMAVAIEDSGFELRDSIAWLYGSGFPKSMDVSSAIDKLDATRERRGRALRFTAFIRQHLTAAQVNEITGTLMGSHYVTDKEQPHVATAEYFDMLRPHLPEVPPEIEQLVADRTVESQNWRSREVTGQHEKPAAAQVWRAGLLGGNVAGPRERRDVAFTEEAKVWQGWGTALKPAFEPIVVARKPLAGTVAANVIAFGTGALNIDACRVGDEVRSVEKSTGEVMSSNGSMSGGNYRREIIGTVEGRWPTNVVLDDTQAAVLDAQSGRSVSRSGGTSTKAFGLLNDDAWVAREVPRGGHDDEGGASRFFPTFKYEAKAPTSERPVVDGVAHATVKPLALMRWLIRLVTPRGGIVLDPFAGSGTTLEAAVLEGFETVGIELTEEHLPLIRHRFAKPLAQSLDLGDIA